MSVKYDSSADCAYVRYSHNQVEDTIELNDYLIVDVDSSNLVVGIEVLNVSKFLEEKRMKRMSQKRSTILQSKIAKDVIETQLLHH